MKREHKTQKRLVALGLGLAFTALVLGSAWLWLNRDDIAWRVDDARFAKYRDQYASWDKSCPDNLDTNKPFEAGLILIQPDALQCRFDQVTRIAPEDWPDGPLEHRLETLKLAAKLYIMTRDERWLTYRPCEAALPKETPPEYIFNIGEELIPAYSRQLEIRQLPTHFITTKENFFDCTISEDKIYMEEVG